MCYEADSEFDEAAHVAAVIGQNVKNGAKLRDHAILYRMTHSPGQSKPILPVRAFRIKSSAASVSTTVKR